MGVEETGPLGMIPQCDGWVWSLGVVPRCGPQVWFNKVVGVYLYDYCVWSWAWLLGMHKVLGVVAQLYTV